VDDPRFAIAVTVAAPARATGGEVAGPIALKVLRALAADE
jgi:hypothetical protein